MANIGDFDTGFTYPEHNTPGAKTPMTLRAMLTDWVRYRNPGTDAYVAGIVENLLKDLDRQNV